MSVHEKLLEVQAELKAPKGQYNSFGKYAYRSCEDIVEAAKPLLKKHKLLLTITDQVEMVGDRYYIKASACVIDAEKPEEMVVTTAQAREEETKKGMDGSQITGSASSYARKYALNGLFCIDDTEDSDATNKGDTSEKAKPPQKSQVKQEEYICPECGEKIVGIKSSSGKLMTAKEIYQSCGMCFKCYKARQEQTA